tara:strand:- start:179 stop:646 length:468 start_codon:yes stop_codon:yes gene_type:complete
MQRPCARPKGKWVCRPQIKVLGASKTLVSPKTPPMSPKDCKKFWGVSREACYPTTSHELLMALISQSQPSVQTLSDHGFDTFWYSMNLKMPPSSEQSKQLADRLYALLVDEGPDTVAEAVEAGKLHDLLGKEFFWVVYPFDLRPQPMKAQFQWVS